MYSMISRIVQGIMVQLLYVITLNQTNSDKIVI